MKGVRLPVGFPEGDWMASEPVIFDPVPVISGMDSTTTVFQMVQTGNFLSHSTQICDAHRPVSLV
jgi:hypothetical protein